MVEVDLLDLVLHSLEVVALLDFGADPTEDEGAFDNLGSHQGVAGVICYVVLHSVEPLKVGV